jgi:hypothetical protein
LRVCAMDRLQSDLMAQKKSNSRRGWPDGRREAHDARLRRKRDAHKKSSRKAQSTFTCYIAAVCLCLINNKIELFNANPNQFWPLMPPLALSGNASMNFHSPSVVLRYRDRSARFPLPFLFFFPAPRYVT